MGTTTNNGWTYPESTDLVKDGATAIETLATDIDTTLGVYAPSTSGLELINTTSFSGVTSQSFNNVFSATYQSYQIIFRGTQASAANLDFRVRAAGTDLTTSTYRQSVLFNSSGTTGYSGAGTTGATAIDLRGGCVTAGFYVIQIDNPFATAMTSLHHRANFTNVTDSVNVVCAGHVNNTTSYDGFTLVSTALTGKVSVYGYNE
jgi:hypothetical protein